MVKYCIVCSNEIPKGSLGYNNKKYQLKKYCGASCHHEHMKKKFFYKCSFCEKQVIRTKENLQLVFCNDICKGKYWGTNKKKSEVKRSQQRAKKNCEYCSKEYSVVYSKKDTSRFCSTSCRAKGNTLTSPATQQKRFEVRCSNCNEVFYKVKSDIRALNFCKADCMYEYYSSTGISSGENSGTWNGGKITYYGENWLKQRRLARKRDNYTCCHCGITENEYGMELSVHHLIPFAVLSSYKVANRLDNLISVCEPCHRKIHSGHNHPSRFSETYKIMVNDIV